MGDVLPLTLRNPLRTTAIAVAVGLLWPSTPAMGARSPAPSVAGSSLVARTAVTSVRPGRITTVVYPKSTVAAFTLVGLTWTGPLDPTTRFRVRVREAGVWSQWYPLAMSDTDATDAASSAAAPGTDPLLTAPADGLEVRATNATGRLPQDLHVELVNPASTAADRAAVAAARTAVQIPSSVVSPAGAIALRPGFVSRAQWGADETWRDSEVAVAPQVNAVFIHHTATTNNYSASQGPAQMRGLYYYFTHVRLYKDVAYNFLVDKYGTVYEGRSGCPRDPVLAADCDGPSTPAVGAHTAGLNTGTFAISVIGNYDIKPPTRAQARRITTAIARTIAWKFAPYGLNPNGTTTMTVGSDPKHQSRYNEGDVATFPTISGHRDVGRTACPGRYLYPYLPRIRALTTELLAPVIQQASVTPQVADVADPAPVVAGMLVPAGSTWSIDVTDPDGVSVGHVEGTQDATGPVTYAWPHTAAGATLLPTGAYDVALAVTHGSAILPTVHATVYLATVPDAVSSLTVTRLSRTRAAVTWPAVANAAPMSYKYRVYRAATGRWSPWRYTTSGAQRAVLSKLVAGAKYRVEVVATNALGASGATSASYRHR